MTAQPRSEGPPAADGLWATFRLDGEALALRVEDVQEVLMAQPLTPVPLAPAHIVGLLNLRGTIMPAIDLRLRLRFPPRAGEAGNLIVVRLQDRLLALLVDAVGDVLELEGAAWRAPPDTLAPEHRPFVLGICPIDGRVVLGLRAEALAGDDERPAREAA